MNAEQQSRRLRSYITVSNQQTICEVESPHCQQKAHPAEWQRNNQRDDAEASIITDDKGDVLERE